MAQRKKRTGNGARTRKTPSRDAAEQTADLGIPWPTPKCDLAAAVSLVEEHADRPFSLTEVVKAMQQHARIRNPEPQDHIRSLLSEATDLARIPQEEIYIPAKHMFQDAAFYIAPTELELAEGILVPGHRFYPFMSEKVTPNTVTLSSEEGIIFPKKVIIRPFGDLLIFHSLLSLADTLFLCSPANARPLEGPDSLVEIEVYDLSAFYDQSAFSEKGLILARVLDYTTGSFQLTYASTQTRFVLQKEMRERDALLEEHLEELLLIIGPDLPLRLLRDAYAHLFREGMDLSKPASAFGPLLSQSKRLTIAAYHSHPCLVPKDEDPMEYYGILPVPTYDGRCETLEDLFAKGGLSVDMPYVHAAILDDLDHEGADRETVIERIMKGRTVPQWDEDDRIFFREEFDKLWEEMEELRREMPANRKVQALRRQILAQCDTHLAFLRRMDRMELTPDDLPVQEMVELAGLDNLYHQLLTVLEMPPETVDLQVLEEQLTALQGRGEDLRAGFETAFDEEEDWDEEDWDEEDWDASGQEIEGPVPTYVLKVKFKDAKSIWRKIEIAGQQSLHFLHRAIQDAIGWDDDHLYSFFMSNRRWDKDTEFASPYAEGGSGADAIQIGDLGLKPGQKFLYLFDYGDEHTFEVEVVEVIPDAPTGRYPRLIEGKGNAPEQYPTWE